MSYSRWSGPGSNYWYTYWLAGMEDDTRDTATLAVDTRAACYTFTASRLRDDLEGCLESLRAKEPLRDVEELKGYITQFLADVDEEFPAPTEV
jgi:hypothetical protein